MDDHRVGARRCRRGRGRVNPKIIMLVDHRAGQDVIKPRMEVPMKPSHHPIYPVLLYLLVALLLLTWVALS